MVNHKGTVNILTKRLRLRKFEIDDAELAFENWMSDNKVTKYLTWFPHKTINDTVSVISSWINEYNNLNFYQWAIVDKANNQPIGSISVVRIDENNGEFEVGYCLSSGYWNNGYMTEALQAVIEFLFNEVGVERVFLKHDSNNPASGRVMQKCGLKFVNYLRKAGKNVSNPACDLVCYAITKEEFNANKTKVSFDTLIKTPVENENFNGLYALVGKANDKAVYADLTNFSSTVIYGSVGVGVTSFLNGIILSLANRYSHSELKFAFITNNRVDFSEFLALKRLYKGRIFIGVDDSERVIKSLIKEANLRKKALKETNSCDINEYNLKAVELKKSIFSKIVVFVNGYENLKDKGFSFRLGKLNAIGKTVGIHLVINCVNSLEKLPKTLVKTSTKFVMGSQNYKLKNKFIKVKGVSDNLSAGEVVYANGENQPVKAQIVNLTDDDIFKWVCQIRFSR